MKSNNLDSGLFHAMRAFLRVLDSGSFTAAAAQMGLTTAQVSRLVSDLERRVGAKLLQRTTRQRALTEAGSEYADRCRDVLGLVEEAEAHAAGIASSPKGLLRIQCMANFGQHYVAPTMADFCTLYPQLTVEYSTSQYVPDLLAGGVDVSLYLAESLKDSGVVARRMGTTFSILCASPDYLARHGEPRVPDDLHDFACLRLENPSITPEWRLTDGDAPVYQLSIQGPLIATTPEMLLATTLRGAGITLLPLFSVVDEIRSGHLRRVLPRWRSLDIGVFALLPSRQFVSAKTRAWLDWVERRISPRVQAEADYFR